MKNEYIKRLNKISVKGVALTTAFLACFIVIQFVIFFLKIMPGIQARLSGITDLNIINYVEHTVFKVFSGMWVWPLLYFLMSGLFLYAMHNIKKIIAALDLESEEKNESDKK